MHILCAICSDLVNPTENLNTTICGHLFHSHCLAQWTERSQSCPQCRCKVTENGMFRIYPTVSNEHSSEDAATLQSRLDDAVLQLRQQKIIEKDQEHQIMGYHFDLNQCKELLRSYVKKLASRDSALAALREQLEYVKVQNRETVQLKDENETLKQNMQVLNGLQKVLIATNDEVEQMLQGYTNVRTVATFATALKRALSESEAKKIVLRDKLRSTQQECQAEKANVQALESKLAQAEDRLKYANYKLKKQIDMNQSDDNLEKITAQLPEVMEEVSAEMLEAANIYYAEEKSKNPGIETPAYNCLNYSFTSLVESIVQGDSPYLKLKQSSHPLGALQAQQPKAPPGYPKIPSAAFITVKDSAPEASTSIFRKKPRLAAPAQAVKPNLDGAVMDISYDGLGGHSRPDVFPTPSKRALKSCVPKLTAKHKLRRPATRNQDISKMMAKRNK